VRIVDANVLLYAANADAVHHRASRAWLDAALGGGDTVGLSWIAMLAFLRLSTKAALFPEPLTTAEAVDMVSSWISAPGGAVVHPGPAHATHLGRLLEESGSVGDVVNDAHLAALAIEHRAEIVSYDHDFTRFIGVRWRRPDDLQ
jgi:toxin-antitoxin system PIN domain toxin